jgi:hypothetical protein
MIYQIDFNDLPVVRNVRIMQGDTYHEPYEIWLNGLPLSLVSATITVAVRRGPGKGNMVLSQEISPEDAQAGKFTVTVPASVTATMLGEYYYEVEVAWEAGSPGFPGGCTKTLVAGAMHVYEDVLH